jgi:hypothetical protein
MELKLHPRKQLTEEMTLADEALGALMMALQKSLLEQSDIVPVLKEMRFRCLDGQLFVINPPIVKFGVEEISEEDTKQE